MTLPVSERIAELVTERLFSDGTATGGVIRPTRIGGFQPKDYQLIITQGAKSPNDDLSCPGNPPAIAWDFPITIAGVLRQSETDETAIDTIKNTFEADVIKAINSGSAWWSWDGLAIDSKISGVSDYQAADGSGSGFEMTLTITYRVAENDPYEVMA
jgi:hypothetical protein